MGWLGCAESGDHRSVGQDVFSDSPGDHTQRRDKQKVLNDRLGTWVEIPKSFGVVLRESLMARWADIPRDCGNQVQTCNYIFNSTRLLILSTGCKRWDPDSQAGTSEQTDVAATSPQNHPTPFVWPSSKPMIRVLF